MTGCDVSCVVSVVFVGFIWGATNPLIRAASVAKVKENVNTTETTGIVNIISKFFISFLDWRFSIPFLVNQSASVLFNILVVNLPVTVVVPCVNAVQFLATALVGRLMGEKLTNNTSSRKHVAGMFLTIFAIFGMLVTN